MRADSIDDLPRLTADLVLAYAAKNEVTAGDLPALFSSFHQALAGLNDAAPPDDAPQRPAVPIRSSIKSDHLVCLEDGRKLKMLKRHLMAHHGMTPAEYRTKWKLPVEYPMVALDYLTARKALARQTDLGQKAVDPVPQAAPAAIGAPAPDPSLPLKRKVLTPLFARKSNPIVPPDAEPIPASDAAFERPLALLRHAIERRLCVRTSYNKRNVALAPHILFTRHDELFLRAVTVEQDGRKPREWKLGTFKLAGLGPVAPTATPFVRYSEYAAEADRTENIMCALAR